VVGAGAAEGFDRAALAAAVTAHGAVVRVVVAQAAGSVPREPGAAMLVWTDAEGRPGQEGTIGGGALEWEAAAVARRLLSAGRWGRQLIRQPLGPGLGQCCGGHVTLLLERFGAEEVAHLATLDPMRGFVRPVASGASPDAGRFTKPGNHSILLDYGRLVEPFAAPALPVWLYGAGHVGRAVVRVAEGLPLAVTWVDTAPERFPQPTSPHASRLVAADPSRVVAHAPDAAVHLVMTHSHALDLAICRVVLVRPHRRLGLIGSATKKARFVARLRAAGLTEAQVAGLTCPIGERGLGKLPAAIALGVVRDLLLLAEPAALERSA
jgi:xanthine dehydrogenase accessory factor